MDAFLSSEKRIMGELMLAQLTGSIDEIEFLKAKGELRRKVQALRNSLLKKESTAVKVVETEKPKDFEEQEEKEQKPKKKTKGKRVQLVIPKEEVAGAISEEEKELQEAMRKEAERKVVITNPCTQIFIEFVNFFAIRKC